MSNHDMPGRIIGILALQGDYEAHRKMLEECVGVPTTFVRTPEDLERADAIVLPGGESTTIAKLMERIGLDTALRKRAEAEMPFFGTCAGLILLARGIEGRPDQPTLGLMDLEVARNAFGRQIESFEASVPFDTGEEASPQPVNGVFIRAPYVTQAGPDVQVLSHFRDRIVAVRQGPLLGTAFHPELTENPRVHAFFARMVADSQEKR